MYLITIFVTKFFFRIGPQACSSCSLLHSAPRFERFLNWNSILILDLRALITGRNAVLCWFSEPVHHPPPDSLVGQGSAQIFWFRNGSWLTRMVMVARQQKTLTRDKWSTFTYIVDTVFVRYANKYLKTPKCVAPLWFSLWTGFWEETWWDFGSYNPYIDNWNVSYSY